MAWSNQIFKAIFPHKENIHLGAIGFKASQAQQQDEAETQIKCYRCEHEQDEAQQIITLIQQIQTQNKQASIAILVKARSHLSALLPSLHAARLSYQAHEINTLTQSSCIQDLWALTRALLHPNDRIAWLSVLRAPWCGLTLQDLHQVARSSQQSTILALLQQTHKLTELSADGLVRLQYIAALFINANQQRKRQSLASAVKQIWFELGGEHCIDPQQNLAEVDIFFDLLANHESGADLMDFDRFAEKLQKYYSQDSDQKTNLHIMTIHKAKGLEFDVVI